MRYFNWIGALSLAVFGIACTGLSLAQGHVGRVTDWSSSRIIVSGGASIPSLMLAEKEQRVAFALSDRYRRVGFMPEYRDPPSFSSSSAVPEAPTAKVIDGMSAPDLPNRRIDWSVDLGAGNIAPYQYPAKYGFYPNATPDCVNDYVVFALDVAGVTSGQANLLGVNQLYSGANPTGFCGTSPHINWAYNGSTAGGKILSSPALSLDGTKVAYVESATGAAIFHVLTWHAGEGTSATTAAGPVSAGSCTPTSSCLLSITYSSNSTISDAFLPWVDYGNDKAFVASNNGRVYRISCVFHCPLNTNPTVDWNFRLPVAGTGGAAAKPIEVMYNSSARYLHVSDALGEVWTLNASGSTPSLAFGPFMVGGGGCTVTNPPGRNGTPTPCDANGKSFGVQAFSLDVTSQKLYAFSGNDGTPGASAVVVQMGADLSNPVRARVGLGSVGNTTTNADLHLGQMDNNYWGNSPSTGYLFLCGTGTSDTTPWRYRIGFANYPLMDSTAIQEQQQVNTPGIPCGHYSEFYNPNVNLQGNPNHHDLMLSSLIGSGYNGNVILDDISQVPGVVINFANYTGGVSGIVIDNSAATEPYPQASSIYFGTLKPLTAAAGTCSVGQSCAVKLSQLNLQ